MKRFERYLYIYICTVKIGTRKNRYLARISSKNEENGLAATLAQNERKPHRGQAASVARHAEGGGALAA